MRKTHFERLESETSDVLKTMQDMHAFQLEPDKRYLPAAKIHLMVEAHQRIRHSVGLLVMAGAKLQPHQCWLRVYFLKYMNYANIQEAAYAGQLKSLDIQIPKRSEKVNLMLSYLHKIINHENPVAVLSFIYVTEYCMSNLKSTMGLNGGIHHADDSKNNGGVEDETIGMLPEIINLLCEEDLQFLIETSRTLFKLFHVTHRIDE